MPTYAFRCPKGHEFERFYKTMSAAATELPCPQCGAIAARQLSGGAGLHFKGGGFYLTDYGKNAHRGEQKSGGGEGKAEAGKTDGAKTEGVKSDAGQPGSKKDGAKASESSTPKAESPKPRTEPSKPKSE
jgi:putative FmdB family regulatory protein